MRKNGDVNFVYLDPDGFLEIRILTQRIKHGAQEEVETDVGDYEKIGGVFVPFSIESGRKGDPDKQKIIIDKAEANVPVDDAIFHFPGDFQIIQLSIAMRLLKFTSLIGLFVFVVTSRAQQPAFSSATISGLGRAQYRFRGDEWTHFGHRRHARTVREDHAFRRRGQRRRLEI